MRWDEDAGSDNVQDDRGQGGGFGGGGGGFGLGPVGIGGGGLGVVIIIVLALLFGVDPRALLGEGGPVTQQAPVEQPSAGPPGPRADDEDAKFSSAVLKMTENAWSQIFAEHGSRYEAPTLVLYDRGHQTGCGFGQSAMGPFYCPADHKVYLDLAFFKELSGRFGAPGRFAEAYVIAHEVGHHVQNLEGTSMKVQQASQRLSKREANQLSVRTELQADCYAGVWAKRENERQPFLDPGDIEQGLAAAEAVGDDTLQQQSQGRVVPDAFTHGSSEQRMRWFKRGYESGKPEDCNTFQGQYAGL